MTDLATDTQTPQRRIARPFWFAAGSLSLLFGMIGVVLPVLPTTCFVLFAAFAYSKSTPRMARYLETHPVFGPIITGWIMGVVGPSGYFLHIATLCTMMAAYAAYRMTQRATPDDTDRYTAVVPGVSPMAVAYAQEVAMEAAEEDAEDGQAA